MLSLFWRRKRKNEEILTIFFNIHTTLSFIYLSLLKNLFNISVTTFKQKDMWQEVKGWVNAHLSQGGQQICEL